MTAQLAFQSLSSNLQATQSPVKSEGMLSRQDSSQQIEQTLVEIWCEVLDIPQVDIHQNFFYLGGDALRILQVHCMASEKGFHFSLPNFYTHPTIHELAQVVVSA